VLSQTLTQPLAVGHGQAFNAFESDMLIEKTVQALCLISFIEA